MVGKAFVRYNFQHYKYIICKIVAFDMSLLLRSPELDSDEPSNNIILRKFGMNPLMLFYQTQKPYVCDVCNKAFRYSQNLKRHRKTHRESTTSV